MSWVAVGVSYNATDDDGEKFTEIITLDDNVWEKELAKTFAYPKGMQINMEVLAGICLREITFYGFSPIQRR